MALETSFSNIVIKNNIIDQGQNYNGSSNVSYQYTEHAHIYGSSVIHANTFISPSLTENMLNIDNCSCIITNNKFIRGVNAIGSYITNIGTNEQTIINNIFDSSTVDGSSDVLVSGLTDRSIYHSNKNQTIYVPVSYLDSVVDRSTTSGLVSVLNVNATGEALTSGGLWLQIDITNTVENYINILINLNNHIPDNSKLLECKIGIFGVNAGATVNVGQLSLNIVSYQVVRGNYTAGAGSILDYTRVTTYNESQNTVYSILTNLAALVANTQYTTIAPSNTDNFINNKNNSLTFKINTDIKLSVAGTLTIYLSPLVMKCRW